jgi:hypothetical protein
VWNDCFSVDLKSIWSGKVDFGAQVAPKLCFSHQVLKKREHQNQKIKQYFTSLMPQANA